MEETLLEYPVIYERTEHNWATYSPDVPGCVATAKTREEVEAKFRSALEFHFRGLKASGEPIPLPRSQAGMVKVAD